MPEISSGSRGRSQRKIPRIDRTQASQILARVGTLLQNPDLVSTFRAGGFARILERFDDGILQLAIQPDTMGERTRARLVGGLITCIKGILAESASPEEIADFANVVLPCFLLELGRRREHIEIEFPKNPCEGDSQFQLVLRKSGTKEAISAAELSRLVDEVGEALVGLCCFGDERSRTVIEREIQRGRSDSSSGIPRCRQSSSPKSKN